jgi:hypothetical protein
VAGVAAAFASPAAAQRGRGVDGRWEARAGEAIHSIVVRADSSAQFGADVARWRVMGDSLWLTLGDGVWLVYGMRLTGSRLTLSGGDLEDPVTLRRVGAAAPRDAAVEIPAAPPVDARAW